MKVGRRCPKPRWLVTRDMAVPRAHVDAARRRSSGRHRRSILHVLGFRQIPKKIVPSRRAGGARHLLEHADVRDADRPRIGIRHCVSTSVHETSKARRYASSCIIDRTESRGSATARCHRQLTVPAPVRARPGTADRSPGRFDRCSDTACVPHQRSPPPHHASRSVSPSCTESLPYGRCMRMHFDLAGVRTGL